MCRSCHVTPRSGATTAASEIALPLPQTASGRFAAALEQFGGAFVSNGVLHVAVTESSAASDARRIVDEHLRASPRGPMTIAVVPARYSYRQLWDWQGTILHDWAILQLRSVAVDERANRLRIGVGDSVARWPLARGSAGLRFRRTRSPLRLLAHQPCWRRLIVAYGPRTPGFEPRQ